MGWGRILTALACWLVASSACARDGLNIVIPGIADSANDGWVGISSTLNPTKDRWVIRQEGAQPYGTLTHIDPSRVITIGLEESPRSVERKLRKILESNNATVIVDMDIPTRVSERSWSVPTAWATGIVTNLVASHAERYPKGQTTFLAHSAGTEVAAEFGIAGRGSKPLFDQVILLSPRRLEGVTYPKSAVLVFADGDFYKSPQGHISGSSITRTYGEKEAREFQQQGYKVVRIDRSLMPKSAAMLGFASIGAPGGSLVADFIDRKKAHTLATDLTFPDRKLVYYPPNARESVPIKTGSPGIALKEVSALAPNDSKAAANLGARLRKIEPTPGLGGVSLNATAVVPFEAADVRMARFNRRQSVIEIELNDGDVFSLPQLDPEVLRLAYDVVYVKGEKPELSIGGSTATNPQNELKSNIAPPGYSSVYYYGGILSTAMGLALFEADEALARIAFGGTQEVAGINQRVPGFHSMPELFPEKYTDNPAAARYLGNDERIFIVSRDVELQVAKRRRQLEFSGTSFSVQFSRMGPAEVAFCSFMQAHFEDIADTELGAPLKRLVPFAQAAAIFKWMRENNVVFEAGELSQVPITKVFTSLVTRVRPEPRLEDANPKAPYTRFGLSGPLVSVDKKGKETTFEYDDDLIRRVTLPNGKRLEVYRDALKRPVALVDEVARETIAFTEHADLGLVLADKVEVSNAGSSLGFTYGAKSRVLPIANAEPVVTSAVISFAEEANRR
jgi:hypothetical protein